LIIYHSSIVLNRGKRCSDTDADEVMKRMENRRLAIFQEHHRDDWCFCRW